MAKEEEKINCQTFKKQNKVISNLTDEINMVEEVQEKAKFAEELKKEVDVFISCPDYDEKKLDCQNCRFVAKLRMKTADLIIKTKKLA